jgi:hypothetical protein
MEPSGATPSGMGGGRALARGGAFAQAKVEALLRGGVQL